MNIRRVLSSSVVAVATSVALSAQALPLPRGKPEEAGMSSVRLNAIAATIKADVERGRIPGAVVAIARRPLAAHVPAFANSQVASWTTRSSRSSARCRRHGRSQSRT